MIPLTLYIHFPWCARKCPYCDFNSHVSKSAIPESRYIETLITDLEIDLASCQQRPIQHIFMGGGTPSLFSGKSINRLINKINKYSTLASNAEISLEANPDSIEQKRFHAFRQAGVNRLSIGVQSFADTQLKILGRLHTSAEAIAAIKVAKQAGFNNFNIDLMYGLPQQTPQLALDDLKMAIALEPTHISWYQLTLEPNTPFFYKPPTLPNHESIWQIQQQGQALLAQQGYQQYEISAYSQPGYQCQHNLNYWQFGDYLGIGAGAHGKLTDQQHIQRTHKIKMPNAYMQANPNFIAGNEIITEQLAFEFMLNALRLYQPFSKALFEQSTGLSINTIQPQLQEAIDQQLLERQGNNYQTTGLGKRFLNDLLEMFL